MANLSVSVSREEYITVYSLEKINVLVIMGEGSFLISVLREITHE